MWVEGAVVGGCGLCGQVWEVGDECGSVRWGSRTFGDERR